jgi:hypothetical protein
MRYSLQDQLDKLIKIAEEDLSKEDTDKEDCHCEDDDEECDCHSEDKPELEGGEAKALSMLAETLRSKEASDVTYTDLLNYIRGL